MNKSTAYCTMLLIVLMGTSLLCYGYIHRHILTTEVYHRSLGEQMSIDQLGRLLALQSWYEGWGSLLIGGLLLIRYHLVTVILYTGLFLMGYSATWQRIFQLVLQAELIFLTPLLMKVIWFSMYTGETYILEDVQYFHPLSLLSALDHHRIDLVWHYPMQVFSLFELGYWVALAWGIRRVIHQDFDRSLRIVLGSYLPGLVLWIVLVMFITISL